MKQYGVIWLSALTRMGRVTICVPGNWLSTADLTLWHALCEPVTSSCITAHNDMPSCMFMLEQDKKSDCSQLEQEVF